MYLSCKIYKGDCKSKEEHIGETGLKAMAHLDEFNNPTDVSEPAQHLRNNLNHGFNWLLSFLLVRSLVINGQEKTWKQHTFALKRPKLNNQINHNKRKAQSITIGILESLLSFFVFFLLF